MNKKKKEPIYTYRSLPKCIELSCTEKAYVPTKIQVFIFHDFTLFMNIFLPPTSSALSQFLNQIVSSGKYNFIIGEKKYFRGWLKVQSL